MRRQYRAWLPALAHFFPGIDWLHDIDEMPFDEIDVFIRAAKKCPQIGSVFIASP